MGDTPVIAEELMLRDIETIKVYADQRRMRILQLLQKPATVKAVAAALQIAPSKLYYHINLLLQHGLIQVVGQNLESGIVEKIYQVSARRYKLINPLLMGDAIPQDAAATILGSLIEDAHHGFLQAFANRDPSEATPPRHPFLSKKAFRLTNAQLSEFHTRLATLIQDVTALGEANQSLDEPEYGLTVVFYREAEQS